MIAALMMNKNNDIFNVKTFIKANKEIVIYITRSHCYDNNNTFRTLES